MSDKSHKSHKSQKSQKPHETAILIILGIIVFCVIATCIAMPVMCIYNHHLYQPHIYLSVPILTLVGGYVLAKLIYLTTGVCIMKAHKKSHKKHKHHG